MRKLQFVLFVLGTSISFGVEIAGLRPTLEIPPSLIREMPHVEAVHDSEALSFNTIDIERLADGTEFVSLPGSRQLFSENLPILPVVQRQFSVPKGKKAVVRLENIEMEQSDSQVPLMKLSEVAVWGPQKFKLKGAGVREGLFPGKLFQAHQVNNVVFVDVYPVQFQAASGQLMVLRSADIKVSWVSAGTELSIPRSVFSLNPAVIVTSEKLLDGAKALREFHRRKLQIESDIVIVEELAKSGAPVDENQLPSGYKTLEGRDDAAVAWSEESKKGYPYELAKKIKRYLDERASDGHTKYVTLLGDGTLVPPSYYFSVDGGGYKQWGVTDICYGATKQCTEPVLATGRLPLSSNQEVQNYILKAERWLVMTEESQSELALFGGKAFPQANVFIGELGTLKTLNVPVASWRGVQKFFRTRGNYTKENVLNMVNGKLSSSFVYSLDHGNGNQWYVEREYVNSVEAMAPKGTGEQMNPLVVAIACTNAAFDETTTSETLLAGGERDGTVSVGVGLVKSLAGAVAYLGSSRPAMGLPVYKFDTHGNLDLTGTTHGLQFMDTFYEKYGEVRGGRLGDIYVQALRAFSFENGNDMTDATNQWTYFNVELLGDPVLKLPLRKELDKVNPVGRSTFKMEEPTYGYARHKVEAGVEEVKVTFETSVSAKATLIKLNSPFSGGPAEQVVQEIDANGSGTVTIPTKIEKDFGNFLLRLENTDGVPNERQVWFTVAKK